MAEDELLSLCWNNFNTKLSAGFHESLCRGDLVDVTLAAEGELVKAHKIVLSVCSAYFRKMFTQMPANQHAFIFLKDVSSTALKDLIQFMYCGEVNVKQELLPAFISTAEALQIKGLTDGCPPSSQSPAAPSTSARHRTQTQRATYKIDSLDKNVGKISQPTQATMKQHPQTTNQYHVAAPIASMGSTKSSTAVVTHKRQAQRSSVVGEESHIKRSKNTIDPLEMIEMRTSKSSGSNVETQQITEQTAILPAPELKSDHTIETECIDLPIEVTPKVEPDYFEESGDVDGTDNDGMGYVEDDSYGDVRYNVNYFTDNEDESTMATVPGTSGAASGGRTTATTLNSITKKQQSFSDSSCMETDQGNSEAQEMNPNQFDVIDFPSEDHRSENSITQTDKPIRKMLEIQTNILQRHDVIEKNLHKILDILGKFTKDEMPIEQFFPIPDRDALNAVEKQIKEEPEKYTALIKHIIRGDLRKNFDRVLGRSILENFNYDGLNGKHAFKTFKFLNGALFNALKGEGYNERFYVQDIRQAFKTHKNRLAKQKFDSNKKQIKKMENNDSTCDD